MSKSTNPADMPVWKVLVTIGLQCVAFALVGWALWVFTDRPKLRFINFAWWEIGYGLALAGVLIVTSAGLALAFPRYAEWLVRSQARNYAFLKNRLSIPAIIFISICAGLGEEALFRGGFQTLFADYTPFPLALFLSSALFALIHFAQRLNTLLILAIGCLFGLVYQATGSLLAVIVAHAVYDVYALWGLQEALHRLGVFDQELFAPLQDTTAHEICAPKDHTSGETL